MNRSPDVQTSTADPFSHDTRPVPEIGRAIGSLVQRMAQHWTGTGLTFAELDVFEAHLEAQEQWPAEKREHALANVRAVRGLLRVMERR